MSIPTEDRLTVIAHANSRFGIGIRSSSSYVRRWQKSFHTSKWALCTQITVCVIIVILGFNSAAFAAEQNSNSSWPPTVAATAINDNYYYETSHLSTLQNSPRLFFANHPDGSQSIIGTWFSFTSFTVMMAFFGTAFMLACAATAVYYVLFVVTEPTQHGSVLGRAMNNSPSSASLLQTSSNHWTFTHILQLIYLAYDTYATLDLQNIECQEKILCEFQRTDNDPPAPSPDKAFRDNLAATTFENSKNEVIRNFMRKVSNFLFYLDIFKTTVPNLKEYQEAIRVGQYDGDLNGGNGTSRGISICDEVYSDCKFSVRKFNRLYKRLFG